MKKRVIWLSLLAVFLLAGGYFALAALSKPETVPGVINPGFEDGLNGWESQGAVIGEDGYLSEFCLMHTTGKMMSTQRISELPKGWYILRTWVRSSGNQKDAYITIKDYEGEEVSVSVPIVKKDTWLQIVVSAEIRKGACTISLNSEIEEEDGWVCFDEIKLVPGRAELSVMGADISSLLKSEAMGGVYADEEGIPGGALDILADHGMNYARLRVWVDSADGFHGKQQLLEMARRLEEKDIKLLVDFHYSDTWADPGKQYKPAAWEELAFEDLKKALYEHTYDICSSLVKQGTPPAMVQIGNEINHGMLWPDGKNDQGFEKLSQLLQEGYRAVKDCSPKTLVMLHLAEGGDNELFRWWLDSVIENGVEFDVIGVSYYPYWHGSLADLQNNLNDLAERYQKDLIVVETAYAFTAKNNDSLDNIVRFQETRGYPISPEGQKKMLADVMSIVRSVPGGRGLGIFWWDATWTACTRKWLGPADTHIRKCLGKSGAF